MLADDLRCALESVGAVVIGPVGQLEGALDLIEAEGRIDGAVLDVNLGGQPVFAAADRLIARQVPVVFTTGYDASAIPARYSDIPRCEKPLDIGKLTGAIGRLLPQ